MQTIISMECTECKRRNYATTKNKTQHPDHINLSKYCKHCRRHTDHKEVKA